MEDFNIAECMNVKAMEQSSTPSVVPASGLLIVAEVFVGITI